MSQLPDLEFKVKITTEENRDINRIEFLRHLGHMRCLLGWIGSQTLDSDAQLLLLLLAHKVGWGSLNSFCGRSCLFGFSSLGKKKKKGEGRDIGHHSYAPSMTVANLKKRLLAEWPQAKTVTPKSANEVKLIHSGRILENNKTLADSRITSANQPGGGAVIMHAVVQPPVPKQKKTDKNQKDMQKMNSCSCTLL
ncbi:membrane-anchored ubiquitin-fold protein 3-like [Prunus yedoensis var. nudiflora]|uniref:Membrane-anchored ubiquitin-fold protein 3-like n=1 Tax=Prunus yedoensis var. nudiflora TaxID=2094558 RepID=A0A314XSW8_PRUYE|nr:membrane-anchored ubiquitin-fold protein 3-like [Prunus yedoensis var. nudiflora]